MEVAWSTTIGGRPANEDRFTVFKVSPFCLLLAVADGHGGSSVSTNVVNNLCRLVNDTCKTTIHTLGSCDLEVQREEFKELFAEIDRQSSHPLQGSTLCLALMFPSRVVVANCGDSHALVIKKRGRAILLSTRSHNMDDVDEMRRINDHDITIQRPYVCQKGFGLAMTRAIGDHHLSFVSHEPDVYNVTHDKDIMLILSSDGVTDYLNDEQLIDIMCASLTPKVVVESTMLPTLHAKKFGVSDNATSVCAFMVAN